MLTQEALNEFGNGIKRRGILQSILIELDGGIIKIITPAVRKIRVFIGFVQCVMYCIFLVVQLVLQLSELNKNHVDLAWLILWIAYYIWAAVIYLNGILKVGEVLSFLKGLVKLHRYYTKQCQLRVESSKKPGIIKLLILMVDFMCLSFAICSAFMTIMLPSRPQFISSLLNEAYHTWWLLSVIFVFEFYSKTVTVGAISFMTITQSIYMILACFWTKLLEQRKNLQIREKLKELRILEILNVYFNYSHTSASFAWTLTMFFSMSIITLVCTIRFHQITHIFEYMLFPMAMIFLLIIMAILLYGSALVYTSSVSFLNFVNKGELLNKKIRKDILRHTPFGVRIGTMRFVKKSSLLTVYENLSSFTISLLIAFPDTFFHQ